MDELVLGDIARQVLAVDEVFVESRVGMIEKVTQWDENLYLNWRWHVLSKKVKEKKLLARVDGDRRDEYMKWRYLFLERKFEKPEQHSFPRNMSHSSLHSSASSSSLHSDITDDSPPPSPTSFSNPIRERRSQSLGTSSPLPSSDIFLKPISIIPKNTSSTSLSSSSSSSSLSSSSSSSVPPPSPSRLDFSDYTFTGMHHIFAETTQPITSIEFGNNNNDILAFGSQEGNIYICSSLKSPRVLHTLKGHTSPINGIKWIQMNNQIVSSALDSVRVWDRKTGNTIKILKENSLSLCLHPTIDSIFLISDNKGYVKVINIATGKSVLRVKALANITCMQFDTLGQYLFAGDDKGFIEIFKYTKDSGALQLLSKTSVITARPIVNISFKSIYVNQQFSPSILVNCRDNSIKMFLMKNTPNPATLVLYKEFPVNNKKDIIKSKWCPSVDSSCLVTGSENTGIYFYDMKKKENKPVNTLMGHSASVTRVSWASDESMLASADLSGMVILWSRKK